MANNLLNRIIFLFLFSFLFFSAGSHKTVALILTSSENITISAKVGNNTTPGSGGGSIVIPHTAVRFSGLAYPYADITLLEGNVKRATVTGDDMGYFTITLEEDGERPIAYTLFATDISGNKSLLINYYLLIHSGYLTHVSGIRFAPTIVLDKAEAREGDYVSVIGYSVPEEYLEIIITGKEKKSFTLVSSKDGAYKIILPLSGLPTGDYIVSAKYINDTRISKLVKLVIGDTTILNTDAFSDIPGDYNLDMKVDLVDFSILAFWYGKESPPPSVDTNRDGTIDLVDFSILAFWWTG